MIRNTLLAGLLVLMALIFGTPALIGLYLARNFDHYVARINRPGVLRIIGTRFQRGWFESQAQITVQLADRFCVQPPCATFTLDSSIHQGPLTFTAPLAASDSFTPAWLVVDSRLALAPLWPRLAFTPPLAPLHVITRVGLAGQVSSHSGLPAAGFDVARKSTVAHAEMAPLTANAATTVTGGPLNATVAWPLLRIKGVDSGHIELHGLRAGLVTAAHDRGRIVEQHLRLNSLTLDDGQGQAAQLRQLVWHAQAIAGEDDGMATHFNSRIKRIVFDAKAYGPLVMEGRIEGVDRGLWRALKNQFIAAEHSTGPDASTLRTLYRLYLPPVLAAGPAFDIKLFSLITPAGEVNGQLHIAVPDDIQSPQSLSALLDQVRLTFRGRVPAPLLRRGIRHIAEHRDLLGHEVTDDDVERALKLLTKKGLIQPLDDGHAYHLKVALDRGRLRINDHAEADWSALLKSLRADDDAVDARPSG